MDVQSQSAGERLASKSSFEESEVVGVTGLCCRTPDGGVLFNDMTFTVQRGQRLLVMGPSGVGKSSLLRIIAGLWPVDDGIIYRYTRVSTALATVTQQLLVCRHRLCRSLHFARTSLLGWGRRIIIRASLVDYDSESFILLS